MDRVKDPGDIAHHIKNKGFSNLEPPGALSTARQQENSKTIAVPVQGEGGSCPFANLPEKGAGNMTADKMQEERWVKPKVVVEIAFNNVTAVGTCGMGGL